MGTDRRRTAAQAVVALGVAACAASSVALFASACLPDLIAASPEAASPAPTVEPVAVPTCGDGVIDSIENGGATNEDCDPGDGGEIGCTADCRIACDGGVVDTMGHCYFTVGSKPSFKEGQDLCGRNDAHIVTITSPREADVVRSVGADGGIWIGLSYSPPASAYVTPSRDEPGWPGAGNGCAGCFAVGTDDAGKFENDDAGVDCVVANGARWADHSCGGRDSITVVCEREPVGQRIYFCGGPNCTNLPATLGVKRYVLPTNLVTADEASAACVPYGSIVMLDSPEEREQLVHELVARFPPPLTVWIGLSSIDGGARWSDDDGGRPLPWANAEPATDGPAYLAVADPGTFVFDTQLAHVDGDRSARRLVVCQRK